MNESVGRRKKAKYYDEAAKLYIEDFKIISEISKILNIGRESLYKWRNDGEWDRKRAEYQRNVKSLPELIQGISANVIRLIAAKNSEEITSSDMEMLAKANKVAQAHRDPREILKVAIEVFEKFASFIMKEAPDLGAGLSPYLSKFLDKLREENNE